MFKIDLTLNTVMWNEGFEKADYPWLRLYTNNAQWVQSLPPLFNVLQLNQDFNVSIDEFTGIPILPDSAQKLWEDIDNYEYQEELADHQQRFYGILHGLIAAELNKIIEDRINYWGGI